VQDNPGASQYELFDGDNLVGIAQYRLGTGQIAFTHTEVAQEYEGHGYGSELIRAALDDARERGLAVLPYCGFVRRFIAEHPEYLPLVPAARRPAFNLV
jgi:predicted GNAT family acetyltransferase